MAFRGRKMRKIKHDVGLRIVKFLVTVFATVPFALCWYLYFADTILSRTMLCLLSARDKLTLGE